MAMANTSQRELPEPVIRLIELIFEKDFKGDQAQAYDHYKKVKSRIRVLSDAIRPREFEMIEKYIRNTHGPTHKFKLSIEHVYIISRYGEFSRYRSNRSLGYRTWLWHGTQTKNFLSILTNGLLIQPPADVKITGKMFGKGIYFADVVTKAAQYCGATKANPYGILILAEVILGTQYNVTRREDVKELQYSKGSVKGLGKYQPDPKQTVRAFHGADVPVGTLEKHDDLNTVLDYNEYIVYQNDHILFEYLVLVKFNFQN